VLIGSEVIADDVTPGRVAPLHDEAFTVLTAICHARARLPESLRRPVDVHLDPSTGADPRITSVETHMPSASLLVASPAAGDLDASMWLHELAHVAAAGPRPKGPIASRLLSAVDEAVADYGAAAVGRRTALGPVEGAERRDLANVQALSPEAFQALALPGGAFEAHRLGLPLAAALYQREPVPGPLLEDLISALSAPAPWPATPGAEAAASALIERTPARSRRAVAGAIAGWLPHELHP